MSESTRILLINGHPQAGVKRLNHTLLKAYEKGAREAMASLDFPLLRSQEEWEDGELPVSLEAAQGDSLGTASDVIHSSVVGRHACITQRFSGQIARPGFAFHRDAENPFGQKARGGRSARVVVTMGMPAVVYRWYFRAYSVKSLERNILAFVGIASIGVSLVGGVDSLGDKGVKRWQSKMRKLGLQAE